MKNSFICQRILCTSVISDRLKEKLLVKSVKSRPYSLSLNINNGCPLPESLCGGLDIFPMGQVELTVFSFLAHGG
jgi:hypothetical protein